MKKIRWVLFYCMQRLFLLHLLGIKTSFICLGIITFLLVTTVLPSAAQYHSRGIVTQQVTNATSAITSSMAQGAIAQGKKLYDAGRYSEAASVWQQAAQGYQSQGDRFNQSLTLSYLSLAYQKLGHWQAATTTINQSIEISKSQKSAVVFAQILNTQASLQLAMGQTETALNTWQQAEAIYTKAKDDIGILGSQINQAQALQTLGLYRRSQLLLEQVNQKLQAQPDSPLKATGLHSLGVAMQATGDLNKSSDILTQSLAINQKLNLPLEISTTLLSLGNTTRALGDLQAALKYYQKAATITPSTIDKLEAQLNQFSLLVETKQWQIAQNLLPGIESNLATLSPSQSTVYARVNLAQSLIKYAQETSNSDSDYALKTAKLLATAVQQAQELKNPRAHSYALGILGKLYEQKQQWQEAKKLTRTALELAQQINASDIAYQWQWQLGRILKAQGDIPGAIAIETQAVKTLQSLRRDLVAINPDIQFSFRESVEPVYRQLVELLLSPTSPEISQENLKRARNVIESLQLAELNNFFREACLDAKPKQIDRLDSKAAVFYSIILSDRLAVILSLPNQPLRYYATMLPQEQVEDTLEQLLQSLNPAFSNKLRLRYSQQVYNWLIQPIEKDLDQNRIETLVFVLDGSLRNLPMSALYDGQKYLIEKYSIALTPGLQLLESNSASQARLKAIMAGVSENNQGFAALPGVKVELEQIGVQIPNQQLLNQEFTSINLQKQIQSNSFPIVHLATHGQFSSNPEETFILTWDNQVKVKDFENLLRSRASNKSNPIELLVLSACQTAAGDKRATLGLAGIAVRSGARSTVATLWSVKDESTALFMTHFYEQLKQSRTKVSKAEALRQSQLALLKSSKFEHPFYWAPFILVGHWL